MGNVPATEFKAKCLALMDRVAERRETFVITKRGRPVAKLVPADPRSRASVLGCMRGSAEILGDIVSSPLSDEDWNALAKARDGQWERWVRKPRTRRGRRHPLVRR